MNTPPEEHVRVPHEQLRAFVGTAARAAGLTEDRADRLAELLAGNDLRGVFSHGSRQIANYARSIRDGDLNADPRIEVVDETPTSVLVDGDGGLGYSPAERGTELAVERAGKRGIAAMATRNHGHVGAAGIYAREAVERDQVAFVTSGHRRELSPGDPIYDAAGGPPIAFGIPAGEEHDLVLDCGPMQDLYPDSPDRDAIAELAPGIVLRAIGLASVCQVLGGLLAGLGIDERPAYQEYDGADQAAFAVFLRIDLFADPGRFKEEVDTYVRQVRELDPLEGFDPHLPGGPEAERRREYRREGVPVGPDHRTELEELADELDLEVPWS